jgi:hypothetical protein
MTIRLRAQICGGSIRLPTAAIEAHNRALESALLVKQRKLGPLKRSFFNN